MGKTFEELFRDQLEVRASIAHMQEQDMALTAAMMELAGMGQRSMKFKMESGAEVTLKDRGVLISVTEGE